MSGSLWLPGVPLGPTQGDSGAWGWECEGSHLIPGCESDGSAYTGWTSALGRHHAQDKRAPVLGPPVSTESPHPPPTRGVLGKGGSGGRTARGGRKEQGDEKGSLPGVRGGMDAAGCRVLGSRDHHFLVSSLGRKVFLDMSCSHLTSSRLRTRIKCITLSPLGRRLMLGSPVGRWSTQGKQS